MPFIVLIAALLIVPGMRSLDDAKDPLASVDPPVPPTVATLRAPQLDRIIRRLWYLLLGAFIVSMLTWIPPTWTFVFNEGLAFSVIFLSITLITGMGGQLSLAQATLAGVGAFTAAQLANHLGLNILLGGIVGAVMAAVVATILALGSLRLKGLGLALMTIAAALFFDNSVFDQSSISNGVSLTIQEKWVGFGLFNPNGHNVFILEFLVLVVCVIAVLLIRKGTIGQYLSAMRGSETAAAGLGINLTWQRVMIFAISGAMAGIGGTLLVIQQQTINNEAFSYEFGLAFVVIVVTTGVSTVEGAIQGGIGFVVVQQLLSYLPARLGGNSLVLVLFAFGALQYANHPEGILEFQKRKWTLRFERLLFKPKEPRRAAIRRGAFPVPVVRTDRSGRRCHRRAHRCRAKWAGMTAMTQSDPVDTSLLEVSGVSKSFGGIAAVSDMTFTVSRGESVGLVGPNGAGKTTLFNCICGQLRPEEGTIFLDGESITELAVYKRARRGLGRTYQRVEVFPDMNVREHLLVAERARRGDGHLWRDLCNMSKPTSEELEHVAEALDLVGIADRADTPVSALGLGSCRLVELARALVGEPMLLLADEPSSGLDMRETEELAHVLRTLQKERGMAVLLVEHDLAMVGAVVDRTLVMDLGAKVAEGTFDEVMADPSVRTAYLGTGSQ